MTFPGGVHPPEKKELSKNCKLERMPFPDTYILPIQQHIGAPSKAIVKVGDEVLRGQVVAEAGGFVSVPIHSPASGKVKGLGNFLHPNGFDCNSVIIESDHEDKEINGLCGLSNYQNEDPDEIKKKIQAAGLVGLGGAAFPTHVKLNPPPEKKIDTIILNGAECEPYLTADYRVMLEYPDKVISGLKILMYVLGVKKGFIGIESNKPDAYKLLNSKAQGDQNIKVEMLKVKYPQGAEKQLIFALTGNKVPPPPGLPMDVGIVVQNISTAVAIHEAIVEGKPLMERVVTVTGEGIYNPKNMIIRIGTPVNEVIDYCGGIKDDTKMVIMGGPMMGAAQFSLDVPVIKGTSGILALIKDDVVFGEPQTCLRCGQCVSVCPMNLMPCEIAIFADKKRWDECNNYAPLTCIECGSCSYICPSDRTLVQLIRLAKAEINARRKAAK